MEIAQLIRAENVLPGLPAPDKPHLLGELARRAALALGYDARVILDALTAREALGSTGIGHGIALPHARIPGITQLFGLFAVLERPLDFGAVDDEPVDLVFLLLVPANAGKEHLAALAAISRRLRNREVVHALHAAKEPAKLYEALVRP
jgi:PTS system nitrogen regulatory IIA component